MHGQSRPALSPVLPPVLPPALSPVAEQERTAGVNGRQASGS
ncbi:hypothetical protein [Kitasatospora cineracea]